MDIIAEARRQWAKRYSTHSARGLATVSSFERAAHILRNGVEEVLTPFGVSYSQFEVLAVLMWSRAGSMPMSKISSRLQVPPASLTHTVRKLEKDGLITRVSDPKDKRSTLVMVTDQGIVLASAAGPALDRYFESIALPAREQDRVIAAANRVRRAAGEDVEGPEAQ
ncbi:MarR family winged helix-turn-helix transcriptional regulator [Corynebacterium aurimucosum]